MVYLTTLSVIHARGCFYHRTEQSSFIAQEALTSRHITTTAAGFRTAIKETHCICTLLNFAMNSEHVVVKGRAGSRGLC